MYNLAEGFCILAGYWAHPQVDFFVGIFHLFFLISTLLCSPALAGFTFIQPHSYVYRFISNTKEIVVIKTRTLHVPANTAEVTGQLQKFIRPAEIICDQYKDKILLIKSGRDWKAFSKSNCTIKAAIIKVGDDKQNRSSSPIFGAFTTIRYPTVLIYDNDEKRLGMHLTNT